MSLEGFEFVELLRGRHDFTAKEIAETIDCDVVEVLQVFERLLISGILLKSKRKEEIRT
jgi:CRP-like cAMP-binding protein